MAVKQSLFLIVIKIFIESLQLTSCLNYMCEILLFCISNTTVSAEALIVNN